MRKLVITSFGAMALVAAVGGTALAAYTESPPPTEMVEGTGGQAGSAGEAAFTGGDVSTGMIVAVALVAIGLVALLVARRRATQSS
jgi:hypothetical protein